MDLADRVAAYIRAERMPAPGSSVVVGLSGGADSAALLALLSELGYRILAVHCHFGLRGAEADRDLLHSRQLAERFNAEFRSVRFDTRALMASRSISAEMACRELRYDCFEQLRAERGAAAIAVGHHREDNVETFFLNLLRGSGIHGLRAMQPMRGYVMRPLLEIPRADLIAYLGEREIDYVVDSTNADNDFRRNRLRNAVIPVLEREFPGAAERIADSLRHLRANERLYDELLPPFAGSRAGASPTLLHEWLAPFGFNEDACRSLAAASVGSVFYSPTHCLSVCRGDRLELQRLDAEPERPRISGSVIDRPVNFEPRPGVIYIDADAAPAGGDWQLRRWQPGDRMRPFGMRGSKPVSDLLAEAGVAAAARRNCYVLTLNGVILWVVGVRASAMWPVTPSTKRIIELHHENH